MDSGRKCCNRRQCQHHGMLPKQRTCKQQDRERLPHLIPVRPIQHNSTQVLFVEPNFAETPSEYEEFYDCLSDTDAQKDIPQKKKSKPIKPDGNLCDTKIVHSALQEIACISEKLFKQYDIAFNKADKCEQCMLKQSMPSCPTIENVATNDKCTDRSTDVYTDKCTTDTSAKDTSFETSKIMLEPISLMIPVTVQPFTTKSAIYFSERQTHVRTSGTFEPIRTAIIASSGKPPLTDTASEMEDKKSTCCAAKQKPSCCANKDFYAEKSADIVCKQDVVICRTEKNNVCVDCNQTTCKATIEETTQRDICTGDVESTISSSCSTEPSEICCNIQYLPEPVKRVSPEPDEIVPPIPPPKPKRKPYRLAFPQQKDLKICTQCRFDPSPLIDENGKVFCPGNCGCCLCPWKYRISDTQIQQLKHEKVKVCKCRERGNIFDDFKKINPECSNESYFDVCPCREIAEEKCLEIYGDELWNPKTKSFNQFITERVSLSDVVEVTPKK